MKTSLVTNKLNTRFITTKTKLFTLIAVFLASFGWGQTTLLSPTGDGGFENGTSFSANGWTAANTGGNRLWQIGTGQSGYTGSRAAFIGNDATTVGTTTSSRPAVHLFRSVTIPSGATNIVLTFKYKQSAVDNTYDYLKVFYNSNTPSYGTAQTTGLLTTVDPTSSSPYASFTTVSTTIPNSNAGSTKNLIFTFTADAVAPNAYGAIDDIQITYDAAPLCSGTPTPGTIAANTSQNICSGSTPTVLTVTGTSSGVTGITYQWEESSDNATWANATGGSGATTASYTPPSFGGTTIYYRCKVTCTGSSLFDVTNTATIAPPVIPTTQASSLAFTSVSYSGFTASWTNGNGNRRIVYVSDAAITDPTNNSGAAALTANTTYSGTGQQIVFDGTGTSVTVTGLTLGTTYNVKVIEYTRCGSNPYDNYFNVTSGTNSSTVTTSSTSSVPWSEGFATTTLPANWTAASWSLNTTTAVNPALSSNYLYVNLDGSPSTANLTTPIIGSIPSNYRFVVKYKLANYASPYASPASGSGNFIVAVSTNNGTSYTDVATIANNTVAGWQEYALNLSAYVGQNIRIRLTGNYTSGDYYLAFDDFSVEATPTCFPVTALASSAITYQTATIGWTSPATGTSPSGYEYEVRTSGAVGSGATGLVTSGTTTAPAASVSLTGLNGGTTYSYFVRSDCGGGDFSSWSSATFTTTSCNVPTAVTSSAITTTTATISWTAPATGSPTGYEYEVRTSGIAGSGATGLIATGTTTAPTVSASLNALSVSTSYSIYVRTNCYSGFNSSWTSAASFTTLQIPASVPYSDDLSSNNYIFVNGSQTNKWAYGAAVGNTGSSIYVSNDNGVTNSYSNGSSSVVQVYRDIAIPAGATIAQFSFDWKSNGEIDYDYLRVWLVPTTFIPTAGTQITSGSGRIQLGGNFQNVTTWQMYINNSLNVTSFSNSTMRLVFEWKNDGSDGLDSPVAIDNISFKVPYVWTGTTSTDWATTTNWNLGAIPSSTDNIVIPSSGVNIFPVTTSLTIAAGATLTLNGNARLTVNGTLTNNGTLTLESGATLVQDGSGTVAGSGTFNVKQALTGAGGATPSGRFWYLGSPVSTANSGVFNAAGNNRLWTYSETALAYNTEINDNTTALSPMQGAVVRLGASETSVFTGGLLNTGDYTSSLTRTGTTDSKRGYTLLSNPYPSYLDWSAAFTAAAATNANISSSIWYRSHNSTSNTMVFDIFNASSSVATTNSSGTTTQYIPPMQAFWVYNPNDGTTGSLTFSNSMRSHQSNGGLKSSTDFPAFVRLNLENDGAIDQTVLYFDNNAAAGYDNFDSDKMMLANAAQVYSFVDNKKLAINGMKSIKANKQVPLTVEFPTAKAYSFNATEVVMTDGIVILEDRLTKVFQDLTMNPVYNFDAAAGTDANRFVVHFQANGGVAGIETADDNGIAIVSNASGLVTITLSEELPAMGTIQIIDINGKVIATQAINEQITTMNINAATGVYHVLVDSASKVARKKIVITK
jgi:hypothetical protein